MKKKVGLVVNANKSFALKHLNDILQCKRKSTHPHEAHKHSRWHQYEVSDEKSNNPND